MSESIGKGLESLHDTHSTAEESQKFIDEQAQLIEELRKETDSIQRVAQSSFIKNRITTYFDPFLKRKDLTLEEIKDKREDMAKHAKILLQVILEVGEQNTSKMNPEQSENLSDMTAKLESIQELITSYDEKLANKATRIEKRLARGPEEPKIQEGPKKKVVTPRPAKPEPTTDVKEENPAPVIDTGKSQDQDVNIPLMITKEMNQALADLGYSKAARNSMKPEEAHEIITEQKMFIKETMKAEEGTQEVPEPVQTEENTKVDMGLVFPDGKVTPPTETSKNKAKQTAPKVEKEKTREEFVINNLADLTSLIENPTSIEITDENYEEIFDQTVSILENASREAKGAGNKEVIESLKITVKTLWDKTVENVKPGIIKNAATREFLQDLCAEFAKLEKALFTELKKIKKEEASKPAAPEVAKVETFEGLIHFLDVDLENLEITAENSITIFNDIKKVLNTKFKFVKEFGKAEMEGFKNEMFELEENFNAKFENETDKTKLNLIKKIQGHIHRVFEEIDVVLGITKKEEIKLPPVDTQQQTPTKETTENQPGKIKSLGGINNFITKVLPTLSDDKHELDKKSKEITGVLQRQYELLDENDKEGLLKARATTNKMVIGLGEMSLTGEKDKFGDTLLEALAQFSLALDRKSKNEKPKTEEKADKENPTPAPAPEPQPEKNRSIDDIIDYGDENPPKEIPEAIKKDKGFNSWIERVFNRGYSESRKTPENWYTTYTEQKPKIAQIEAIYKDSKIGDKVFKNFATKSEKESAYRKKVETLEYLLLTDPKGEEKVEAIIASYENTKAQTEKIKSFEEQKKKLEAGYNSKQYKLPQELVLRAVHGEGYELKNLEDMEVFLVDMQKNYNHYKSALKGEDQDSVKLANMYGLYTKTSDEGRVEGIRGTKSWFTGWIKRGFAKMRNAYTDPSTHDYDSKKEFKAKIQALRDAGIFTLHETNATQAQDNIFRLSAFTKHIKERVAAEKISVEQVLSEEEDMPEKALFTKVFPQYLKAVSENDRTQSSAKDAGVKETLFKSVNENIQDAKTEEEHMWNETMQKATGEDLERNEFEMMVKQELAGETMDSIVKTLKGKSLDIKTLAKLQEEFATINKDEADELTYRRVLLELNQAEVSFMAKTKEVSIAENSMKKYEAIFQDGELALEKKTEYADAILKLLKEKLEKQKLNFSERLELKKFIRYFEIQKATFKK